MANLIPHVAFFLLLLAIPRAASSIHIDIDSDSSPCHDEIIDQGPSDQQPISNSDEIIDQSDEDDTYLDEIDDVIDNQDDATTTTTLDEIDIDNMGSEDDDDEQYEDEEGYIVMPIDEVDSPLEDIEDMDSEQYEDEDEDEEEEGRLGVPVGNVVTQAFFNSIISKAAPGCKGKGFYTRKAFLEAAKAYPRFGQLRGDDAKREIAAFFAHVTHETGSLCYVEEINKSTYCEPKATQWPCVKGQRYYGRGPLQLTWNYNYGPCGRANKFDGLRDPGIVSRNPVVAWKASLWFWMKNVRPVFGNGFGATIRAINGALECDGKNRPAVNARVNHYRSYCNRFRVSVGPKKIDC